MFKLIKIGLILIGVVVVFSFVRAHQNNGKKLTAGGHVVPSQFYNEARKAGYYCLNWGSKTGTASPAICIPVDKH